MKRTISVPDTANDLTVKQYIDFLKIEGDDEFKMLSILRIFYGIPLNEGRHIEVSEAASLSSLVLSLIDGDKPLERIIEYKGREYGFIPNLTEITFGEYVDLDTYLSDVNNLNKTVSILYRPVVKRKGGFYEIEEYEGTKDFSDFPLGAALSALLFFYRLRSK